MSASGENSLDCETSCVQLTLNGHEVTQSQQHPQTLNLSQAHNHHPSQFQLNSASDGSLSPQRNQSFIAAVISAIRNATTHSGKRLLVRHNKRHSAGAGGGAGMALHHHHQSKQMNIKSHDNNNQQSNENNGGECKLQRNFDTAKNEYIFS